MRDLKTYGIRLLLLTIVNVWLLYPLYYDIAIACEKFEQRNRINNTPKEALVELKVTKAIFDNAYSKVEQELDIEGYMYDVVEFKALNEKDVLCIVLPDEDESELQHKLMNFLKVKGHGKSRGQHSFSFPIAFYEKAPDAGSFYFNVVLSTYKEPDVYALLGGYKQKIGKPPKCLNV
jgi:hypothetical protein